MDPENSPVVFAAASHLLTSFGGYPEAAWRVAEELTAQSGFSLRALFVSNLDDLAPRVAEANAAVLAPR